jgi:hypothetical protein
MRLPSIRATGLGLAVAGAACLATAVPAVAGPLPVDLKDLPQAPVTFTGQGLNEYLGMPFGIPAGKRLEGDCDLDDDGRDDLVAAGSGWAAPGDLVQTGRVHVIRGRLGWTGGTVPMTVGETVSIAGYEEGKRFGEQVVCAGDVDGDGIDDLAVGMGGGAPGTTVYAYIIYGAADFFSRGSFAIDAAPERVVAIDHAGLAGGGVPTQLAALGDLDDDGRSDLALATGSAGIWVIPGRARADITNNTIDLAQAGEGHLAADGVTYDDGIEAVGDVDGDGTGDIAVGQYHAESTAGPGSGIVQVISGAALVDPLAATFNVATEPAGTKVLFRIDGPAPYAQTGIAIDGLGDLNADGKDDFAVGVPAKVYSGGETETGRVFVLFGRTSHDVVSLPDISAGGGYAIEGAVGITQFGAALASAGDVNGDGLQDLLIGAPDFVNTALAAPAQYGNGAAYVVYGKSDASTVAASTPTTATGALLPGWLHGQNLGGGVESIEDQDGNGQRELIVAGESRSAQGKGELTVLRLGEPVPEDLGPGPDPGPGPGPAPGPAPGVVPGPGPGIAPPTVTPKPTPPRVSGKAGKTSAKGTVTVTLAKRPGAKASKSYKIKLVRKGKVVATGTLKGRKLTLTLKKTGKGKRAKYPRLSGDYTLLGGAGVTKVRLIIG